MLQSWYESTSYIRWKDFALILLKRDVKTRPSLPFRAPFCPYCFMHFAYIHTVSLTEESAIDLSSNSRWRNSQGLKIPPRPSCPIRLQLLKLPSSYFRLSRTMERYGLRLIILCHCWLTTRLEVGAQAACQSNRQSAMKYFSPENQSTIEFMLPQLYITWPRRNPIFPRRICENFAFFLIEPKALLLRFYYSTGEDVVFIAFDQNLFRKKVLRCNKAAVGTELVDFIILMKTLEAVITTYLSIIFFFF